MTGKSQSIINDISRYLLTPAVLVVLAGSSGFCSDKGNLYYELYKRPSVATFISDIKDSTQEQVVDTADLKQRLRDGLAARKSITFSFVDDPAVADIIISCDVQKLIWSKDDPIDMIYATGALVYDLLTNENYAYMEALFSVADATTGGSLWQKRLKIDLTKKEMTQQESLPLINEKAVKIFIRDCFSKRRDTKQ